MASPSPVVLLPHSRHVLVSFQASEFRYPFFNLVKFRRRCCILRLVLLKLGLALEEDMEFSNHGAGDLWLA